MGILILLFRYHFASPLGFGRHGLSFSECRLDDDPNIISTLRASHSLLYVLAGITPTGILIPLEVVLTQKSGNQLSRFLVRDVHELSAEPVKKLKTRSSHFKI